jgi:hypothetical protein
MILTDLPPCITVASIILGVLPTGFSAAMALPAQIRLVDNIIVFNNLDFICLSWDVI